MSKFRYFFFDIEKTFPIIKEKFWGKVLYMPLEGKLVAFKLKWQSFNTSEAYYTKSKIVIETPSAVMKLDFSSNVTFYESIEDYRNGNVLKLHDEKTTSYNEVWASYKSALRHIEHGFMLFENHAVLKQYFWDGNGVKKTTAMIPTDIKYNKQNGWHFNEDDYNEVLKRYNGVYSDKDRCFNDNVNDTIIEDFDNEDDAPNNDINIFIIGMGSFTMDETTFKQIETILKNNS